MEERLSYILGWKVAALEEDKPSEQHMNSQEEEEIESSSRYRGREGTNQTGGSSMRGVWREITLS